MTAHVDGLRDLTPREARERQEELRERVERRLPDGFDLRRVAGADVAVGRRDEAGAAGVVCLDASSLEVMEESGVVAEIDFPYVPGLLSFRELPALVRAWEGLEERPDVVLFDGHGYAHPRRFGLACHGGVVLDVPSVGCAKSVLVGEHAPPGEERGETADLVAGGEVVGKAVRTRSGVRPVYVSVGHRMELEAAVEIVLAASPRYRIPEPIRHADRLAGELRGG